ncbi:right-handed parallel beta-helix repeat-containing protein [Methanobacterium arcticum]|uniref:right-handed parallel beta-helix repeat-containing protein n=1 Tax=Methanobacterium arcticum TaxID=386456 RepID=UPI00064F0A5F|nr:right-handed parallel beta-helix repeat-containing protein [Methanobacterium arcticum]
MKSLRLALALLVFFSMFLMFIGAVSAANLTVNPGGSIQSVINNASNNDTIIINDNNGSAYTYTGNLIINKSISLKAKSGGKVTLKASNSSNPVITVNSLGKGTVIQGFTITGATNSSGVYLNGVLNCNVVGNSLNGNYYGVYVYGSSSNNIISGNTITNSTYSGINLNSNNNTIQNNSLTGNLRGMLLVGSNYNTIQNNTITNTGSYGIGLNNADSNIFQNNIIINSTSHGLNIQNGSNNNVIKSNVIKSSNYGVYLLNSSAAITFNEIVGNNVYGLYNSVNGTANAINNWWGSNNPVVSATNGSDIYNNGGTVTYNPWLILKITANPTSTNGNSTITADLAHNNAGSDTSSQGNVPDGLPVNFTTNLGTISSIVYTRNGKASATFSRGTATTGTATIHVSLDDQNITTSVAIGNTVVDINTNKTYSSIQSAINAASPYDTIQVGSGIYTENIVINKTVTLVSVSGGNAIIQPLNQLNPILTLNCNNITVQGFNIMGATNSSGVYLNGVLNCNVVGNSLNGNYYGVYIYGSSSNNIISGNTITNSTYSGINLNSNNNTIQNNSLTGNLRGMLLVGSNYNTIQNNTINTGFYGIGLNNADSNIFQNNIMTNSTSYGLNIQNGSNNNIIQNNMITSNGGSGIYAMSNLNNIVQNNMITSNGGSGIYIDTDCSNNITILYNGGSTNTGGTNFGNWGAIMEPYSNDSVDEATLLELISNQLVNNIIQNNIVTNNSMFGIYFNSTSNNLVQKNNVTNNSGSGIYFGSGDNAIQNNIVTSNGGSGIYLDNFSSYNLVQNNVATRNTVTGILIDGYSIYNVIQNNAATNNGRDGISVSHHYANDLLYINFNRITNNGRYGIYSDGTASINATNNWWGSNNSPLTNASNIYNGGGTVTYSPWLMLNVSSNPPSSTNKGYTITVNLTHNSNGDDTSSQGHIPDDTPINFTTTLGNVETTTYTKKGKAISTLTSSTNGVAVVKIKLDNLNVNTTVYLGAYDETTQTQYSSIQAAINNASQGDVIGIYNGTYTENIVINKNLTIVSDMGTNPLIRGSITINSSAGGSIIQGLTINGSIKLYANNCLIYGNNIIGNGTSAIIASNSFNNTIFNNTITSNGFDGIHSNYSNNAIYGNIISGCNSGIYSEHSSDSIISNNLTGNYYGVWTYNSTDIIQFNRITGNTYGLRNDIGTINATNNWWGSNANPSTISGDIFNQNGTVIYNPWIVLSVNASPTNSGGNTSVTADLTHNNQGGDTSSQGHIPNGIPVNFTTNFGTIIGSSYTVKGKASTILNLGNIQNATVTATASLDNQTASTTGVISAGRAVLNITSTAIDNSTGQSLNITYTIPLNESVTWFSVLWINKGMFTDELQVIVDGTVVQDRYFHNAAYMTWQNSYSLSVFNAILFANQYVPFISNSAAFWNYVTATYNLTSSELAFVQNHRQDFMDNMTFNMFYSGVPGMNLTVTDPQNNNTISLNFPGNVIQRTSQVIYSGSPCEGVKSFAIATTDVTNDVLQYWSDQYSNYHTGAMNAAYNTFLAALLVEYLHDQIADNITTPLNVSWSRTSPIIVSAGLDAYELYLTLECDHSMGMTVVGTPENISGFNYDASSAISLIEYAIMNYESDDPTFQSYSTNGAFSSVMMSLLYAYMNNNTSVETFIQGGFIIMKSKYNNDNFIVIDPETGIVRDINTVNNFCGGAYEEWNCIKTISVVGNKLYTWQTSNPWDLGTTIFAWNGLGRVFLTSSPTEDPSINEIWADSELDIIGANGTLEVRGTQSAIDITDILDQNVYFGTSDQSIHLVLTDTDGGFIATSPLYLVQTNSPIQPYENFKNFWNLCNDLANGNKHLNTDKFLKTADGVGCIVFTAAVVFGVGGANIVFPPSTTADWIVFGVTTYSSFRAGQSLGEAWNEPWYT